MSLFIDDVLTLHCWLHCFLLVLLILDLFGSIVQLNESIKDEILSNQRMVPPGKALLALNGALLNIEDMDLYM